MKVPLGDPRGKKEASPPMSHSNHSVGHGTMKYVFNKQLKDDQVTISLYKVKSIDFCI
jgi:hypothetical protein